MKSRAFENAMAFRVTFPNLPPVVVRASDWIHAMALAADKVKMPRAVVPVTTVIKRIK